MPIPTAKPTRARQHKPTTNTTIYPPTKLITSINTHLSPAYIEPNDDEHDDTLSQPNNAAIQINSPHGLASISCQALYHVINLAFNSPPKYTIPQALAGLPDCILHNIDIKEVCNKVVHPVTKGSQHPYTLTTPLLLVLLTTPSNANVHELWK
jgi:hypothetical protein